MVQPKRLTENVGGDIVQAIELQQRGLWYSMEGTISRLAAENERLTRQLMSDWQVLLDEMSALQAAGKEVTIGRVFRTERYRALTLQTAAEYQRYAEMLGRELDPMLADAVERAGRDADVLTREALGALPPGTNVAELFTTLNRAAVRNIVATTTSGPLRAILDSYGAEQATQISNALRTGVAAGKNPRVIAREMAKAMNGNLTRATCIARTETMRAYREGHREYYRQSSMVKYWVWYADRSDKTCISCYALHGRKFDKREAMGTHPNCRCSMLPVAKSLQELGYNVPEAADANPYTNGSIKPGRDEFRNLPYDEQRKRLGAKAHEAYLNGEVDLDDFIKETETLEWGVTRSRAGLKDAKQSAIDRGYYEPNQPPTPPSPPPRPVTPPKPPPKPPAPTNVTPTTVGTPPPVTTKAGVSRARIRTDTDIGRRVQTRVDKGISTVQDIKDVGRIIREEANCTLGPEAAAKRARWEELNTRKLKYGDATLAQDELAEWNSLLKEFNTVSPFGETAVPGELFDYQKRLQAALDDVRGFGGDHVVEGAMRRSKDAFAKVNRHYPSDWIEKSSNKLDGFNIKQQKRVRSNYSSYHRRITMDSSYTEWEFDEVMRHEAGHRYEYVINDIRPLERDFRNGRTIEDVRGRTMHKRAGEDVVNDSFTETYAGRVYQHGSAEVLTMGQQTLWAVPNRHGRMGSNMQHLPYDQDYLDFILGMLACV